LSFEIEPRHALGHRYLKCVNPALGLAACREPVQQRRQHISVEMIYELADSAEALAKALRQGSSPSPTLPTVLT